MSDFTRLCMRFLKCRQTEFTKEIQSNVRFYTDTCREVGLLCVSLNRLGDDGTQLESKKKEMHPSFRKNLEVQTKQNKQKRKAKQ